jgi:hypothetical protein
MAIRTPASRTHRNRSGTAENGRTSGRYAVLKRPPRHSSISLPWSRCFVGGQENGNELVTALADLASRLFEGHVVTELRQRFVPSKGVEIHRIQKRAV